LQHCRRWRYGLLRFFFMYKVVVIGSIYGVIRFVAQKIHDMYIKETKFIIGNSVVINSEVNDDLLVQIKRLKLHGSYIHASDVDWLRDQIDKRGKL